MLTRQILQLAASTNDAPCTKAIASFYQVYCGVVPYEGYCFLRSLRQLETCLWRRGAPPKQKAPCLKVFAF